MGVIEWTILTYETSRGEKPVDEFIKKQQTPLKELELALLRMKELTKI